MKTQEEIEAEIFFDELQEMLCKSFYGIKAGDFVTEKELREYFGV